MTVLSIRLGILSLVFVDEAPSTVLPAQPPARSHEVPLSPTEAVPGGGGALSSLRHQTEFKLRY